MFELMFRHDLLEDAGANLRATSLPLFEALRTLAEADRASDPNATALKIWTGTHGIAVLAANRSLSLVAPDLVIEDLVRSNVVAHLP